MNEKSQQSRTYNETSNAIEFSHTKGNGASILGYQQYSERWNPIPLTWRSRAMNRIDRS
jgi:hypothetical protein